MENWKPEYEDLAAMLDAQVNARPGRPFLGSKRGARWEWTTYGAFARMVDAARAALASLGVEPGDRVAVIANNRLEWAVCAYASWTLGAVYVPMYEVQLEKDWKYILADCSAKVCLVSSDAIFDKISAMRPELPALQHVVAFDRAPTDAAASWSAIVERARGKDAPRAAIAKDREAVLIYTSGTTGNPKGVRLAHASLAANVCATKGLIPTREDDRGMCILPWAHAGGLAELTTVVGNGVSTGICEGVEKIAENLLEVQPTWLVAVPRIWHKLHDAVLKGIAAKPKPVQRIFHRAMRAATARRKGQPISPKDRVAIAIAERVLYPKIRERLGGKVRFTSVGAAALSIDVAHFIENVGIHVFEVYGMTEASPIVTAMRPGDESRLGSVGRTIPGVRVAIDHDVDGGDAQQGEIVVYGHCVMLGYYGLAEETAKAVQPDGGLRTGDLGRLDGGYLYITGRVKEVYKLENGKFVAPVPLEEKICLSPYVAQAMLYGLNRPHNVALVVVDKATLVPWCESKGIAAGDAEKTLADPRVKALYKDEIDRQTREAKGYERVVDFVLTSEEFTTANDMLTPTLKLKRRNVMARHGERLLALYR